MSISIGLGMEGRKNRRRVAVDGSAPRIGEVFSGKRSRDGGGARGDNRGEVGCFGGNWRLSLITHSVDVAKRGFLLRRDAHREEKKSKVVVSFSAVEVAEILNENRKYHLHVVLPIFCSCG